MEVQIKFDSREVHREFDLAEDRFNRACVNALRRMGLFVEAHAVRLVKVNTSRLRQSLHTSDVDHNRFLGLFTVSVGSDLEYSVYVELGFQGHFVPFHIAPSLYQQARTRWGWRVPAPSDIPRAKNPGDTIRRYLIPRGRRRPVWGVFVKGEERPFLRPALALLTDRVQLSILQEEFEAELRRP